MRNIFLAIIIVLTFFTTFVNFARAEEIATSTATTVDSFELFWPLSAGKTEDDSLYFLKSAKEQFRGWFLFGDTKKADYVILLGTKRVLEAEKLLKDGKTDLALKTLEKGNKQYMMAYELLKNANSKGRLSAGEIRRDRLVNAKNLLNYLKVEYEKVGTDLDNVKDSANRLLSDYLP